MSVFDAFILGFAFSINILVVSLSGSNKNKMQYTQGFLMAILLALFQCGLFVVGVWLGNLFRVQVFSYDTWIAFGILIIIAVKIIIESYRKKRTSNMIFVYNIKTMTFLAIAAAINPFIVGMGMGFRFPVTAFAMPLIFTGILSFFASVFGIFLGRQNKKIPTRLFILVEGILVIELAVKMLFDSGIIG